MRMIYEQKDVSRAYHAGVPKWKIRMRIRWSFFLHTYNGWLDLFQYLEEEFE